MNMVHQIAYNIFADLAVDVGLANLQRLDMSTRENLIKTAIAQHAYSDISRFSVSEEDVTDEVYDILRRSAEMRRDFQVRSISNCQLGV